MSAMPSGPAQAGTDTAALRLTKVAKTYGRHRALLPGPEILLFDEPGSALDPAGAAWLTSVVARERDEGRLVILVTHDLDAAAAVAEQVVLLRRGRVAFDEPRARWTPQELRDLYEERTRA
jgi:ABC-type Mn2+/Zn2+ transport system ATPase subunit